MGKIRFYKGISNEIENYKGNGNLESLLKDFIPNLNIEKCILLKGGYKVDKDYIVKDEDIIFVKETPHSTAVIGGLAIASALVGLGATVYSITETKKAQKQMEEAQRKADQEKKKSDAMGKGTEQLPFLSGAKNQSALGRNIPYIMGNQYVVPYKLGGGYYSIGGPNGEKQYWNCHFVVGYNNIDLEKINVGNATIVQGPNGKIAEGKHNCTGIYNDSENTVDVCYGTTVSSHYNEGQWLDYKVTSNLYGDKLPHDQNDTTQWQQGIIKEVNKDSFRVQICIEFNGLRKWVASETVTETYYVKCQSLAEVIQYGGQYKPMTREVQREVNDWRGKSVSFTVYGTTNLNEETPSWQELGTITTPEKNIGSTYRIARFFDLRDLGNIRDKDIALKIVRTTPKEKEGESQEEAYLSYINCYHYNPNITSSYAETPVIETEWRQKTTRIAVKLLANESIKDELDEINVMAFAKAKTFIAESNSPTNDVSKTRNPASWILDILTSNVHSHSKFSPSEIDLQSFKDLYFYCEEQGFYTDGAITSDIKKIDILTQILNECQSTLYINNQGKIAVAIEKEQPYAIALLNAETIKSINVTKDFSKKSFAQKVGYINRDSWAIDNFYVDELGFVSVNDIYNSSKIITEFSPKYITSFAHAYKQARYLMAKQKLQPRTITVQVGHEGDFYPLYSKVLLQMEQLKIGLSSGIIENLIYENNNVVGFKTSDICDFTNNSYSYGMVIQTQNQKTYYIEVRGEGNTKNVYFNGNFSQEGENNSSQFLNDYSDGSFYSFGILEQANGFVKVTNEMQIVEQKANADGWELTLKDYNNAIFETGTIPDYKSNLTIKKGGSGSNNNWVTLKDVMDTKADVLRRVGNVIYGSESELPLPFTSIKATAERDGITVQAFMENVGELTLFETPVRAIFEISKDNGTTWDSLDSEGFTAYYKFNRTEDGYLEKDDFNSWLLRARSVNVNGKENPSNTSANVDVSNYLSWEINFSAKINGSGRTCYIDFTSLNEHYGRLEYEVRIKRLQSHYIAPDNTKIKVLEDLGVWPVNDDLSAIYTDENSYKKTEWDSEKRYLNGFSQTLPLVGQNYVINGVETPCPSVTNYLYQIRAMLFDNDRLVHSSDILDKYFSAKPTSAKDITDNAITTNKLAPNCVTYDKIHANVLSAEQIATYGMKTDEAYIGTISGDEEKPNNYWNLANGEFRIGNDIDLEETGSAQAQYFHFKNGNIAMKIANFIMTSLSSIIKGLFKIQTSTGTDFMTVDPVTEKKVTIDGDITTTGIVHINNNTAVNGTTSQGALIIGSKTGPHVSIDNNEINGKNNNGVNKLWINDSGGDVSIGNATATTIINSSLTANKGITVPSGQSITINSKQVPVIETPSGGYPGLTINSAGATNNYIRAPQSGILPYKANNANGTGNGYIGTSYWKFANLYVDNAYLSSLTVTNVFASDYIIQKSLWTNSTLSSVWYVLIGECVAPSNTTTGITPNWDISADFMFIRGTGHCNCSGHFNAYTGYSYAWKVGGSVVHTSSRQTEKVKIGTVNYSGKYYVALQLSANNEGYNFYVKGFTRNKSQILLTAYVSTSVSEWHEFEATRDTMYVRNVNLYNGDTPMFTFNGSQLTLGF